MAKLIAIILGVALHLASVIAHADVPTIGDMSACNQEAREGYRNRSASPTSRILRGSHAGHGRRLSWRSTRARIP